MLGLIVQYFHIQIICEYHFSTIFCQNPIQVPYLFKRFPIWAERDLCLLWWMASADPLGLYSLPILIVVAYFFNMSLPPLLGPESQLPQLCVLPDSRAVRTPAHIWALALIFFSTRNVLCQIPQQFLPSFYLAARFCKRSSHSLFSVEIQSGWNAFWYDATPPASFTGGPISIFCIWESFWIYGRLRPM